MKVTKGKVLKPLNIMVYGEHGLGKTTLASETAKPIYIGSEENDEIDSDRLPRIESWKMLTDQLEWILMNKDAKSYKTLVIDTLDGLQEIAQKDILKDQGGKSMATAFGGYGKAYEKMYTMFHEIRENYLKPLRDSNGMSIVILGHSEKSKHEDPITNTSYDHYSTTLHRKVKPLFEDWVSAILFITYKVYSVENNDGKEHAVGDGSRVILTEQRPSHVAKNRFELDFEIDFNKTGTWKVITDQVKKHYGKAPAYKGQATGEQSQILKSINELLPKLDDDMKKRITVSLKRAGNNEAELNRIYGKIEKLTN